MRRYVVTAGKIHVGKPKLSWVDRGTILSDEELGRRLIKRYLGNGSIRLMSREELKAERDTAERLAEARRTEEEAERVRVEKEKAEANRIKTIADLSKEEKAYFDTLETVEQIEGFLSADPAVREKVMRKASKR